MGEKKKVKEILGMEDLVLICHCPRKRMIFKTLKVWIKSNFEKIIGSYSPCIIFGKRMDVLDLLVHAKRC